MSQLVPINDHMMIEVSGNVENPLDLVGAPNPEQGVRSGKFVAISDFLTFWGFNTFFFDSSLMNEEILQKLYDKYKPFVGKTVYWPERSETGTVIKHEGKEYVFLKWTALMAVKEEDTN